MTNNSQSKNNDAISPTDLLNMVTAKTVDFDMETWRDQDSSCLLCNVPIKLDNDAEWLDDPRLLLCWSCLGELCSELMTKLETLKKIVKK